MAWYDRDELVQLVEDNKVGQGSADRLKEAWISENLTATVCRYLNSGIPVILTRMEERHTQVVVGYFRQEDLASDSAPASELHSDVVCFLVADDQRGPYTRVPVAELVAEIGGSDQLLASVIVPLPRGLWLGGGVAEPAGARLLAKAIDVRAEKGGDPESPLRQLREEARAYGNLAVRSYATTGSDFKQGFAHRVHDTVAARIVGHTRLPKYVWIVEMLDRRLRQQGMPSVRATVVLDASQVADDLGEVSTLAPLIIQIPGEVFSVDLGAEGANIFDDDKWIPTSGTDGYWSGRWHHAHDWLISPKRVAGRAKTAVSPGSRR